MVKKALLVCSAALIAALLPLSVSAAVSTPDGYDARVSLVDWSYNRINGKGSFSPTYSKPNVLDVSVSGTTLSGLFSTSFADFSLLGYWDMPVESNGTPWPTSVELSFTFDGSYDSYYLVFPTFFLREGPWGANIVSPSSSYNSSISLGSYTLSWSDVFSGGPRVDIEFFQRSLAINTVSITYYFNFRSDDWGDYSGNLSIPIYAPLCFTTQESADLYVRDMLGNISGKLDDMYDGLFSDPPDISAEQSRYDDLIDDTRSRVDQALADASVPQFEYSAPSISLDGDTISQGFSFFDKLPWLGLIFATAVGCWITHLLLYGVGK